ncbi:MAG: nucleotidyltransferase domain-containing protein, partial [Candidatus Hydrothermarchaeales archaeon]
MQGILSRIKPTQEDEEKLISATQELLRVVEANTQKVDKRISVKLVGSSSRGTWLRDAKDLDVFVFFPLEYEKSKMEEVVSKIGRSILQKPQTRYAEHPYIKGGFSGYDVELVPCYAVEIGSEIKSAVDRTPFHEE